MKTRTLDGVLLYVWEGDGGKYKGRWGEGKGEVQITSEEPDTEEVDEE